MNLCCSGFQFLLENAGLRGSGLFVKDHMGIPAFYLQFRALDYGALVPQLSEEQKRRLREAQFDPELLVQCEVPLKYCPWCGKLLADWYSDDWRELAEATARFD